jgi:hypothetical protein
VPILRSRSPQLLNKPGTPRHTASADPDATILIPDAPYLDTVRSLLGILQLDPCSSPRAQLSIEAQSWYRADQADAALAQPWGGTVFLHPHPNPAIARRQVQKLLRDYLANRVTAAVLLSARSEFLRLEPLLLSFPLCIHLTRLKHWRWEEEEKKLVSLYPSYAPTTFYLPARDGSHFSDPHIERFLFSFARFGRPLIAENTGDEWQQSALRSTWRWTVKPILTTTTIDRHGI